MEQSLLETEIVAQLVKKSCLLCYLEGSLLCLQESVDCTLLKPGASSSHPYILFLQFHVNIIHPSLPVSPK
jgi:hypothetical protein